MKTAKAINKYNWMIRQVWAILESSETKRSSNMKWTINTRMAAYFIVCILLGAVFASDPIIGGMMGLVAGGTIHAADIFITGGR